MMKITIVLNLICVILIKGDFPFRNTSLPWDDRVSDLVWRLSLEELVDQLAYGGGEPQTPAPGIERLNIKPFNYNTECLRGVVNMPSTSFPQSVGLAASFNPDSLVKMAEVIAVEARAFYNNANQMGVYTNYMGVNCFAPFINIVRHPLWGRIQEVYGEDPYLSGLMAAAYVTGLQGTHPRYITASAGCKVIDVHSGPENIPVSRFSFNAVVTERDMRLTYLPNFKMCVEAGSMHLMCSYNSINGTPACANKWLMQDIIRDEYSFKGFIISDAGAIEYIYGQHHFTSSPMEAAVVALKAGVNLDLPPSPNPYFLLLTDAVKQGLVTMEEIVERAKPLFYVRMRLGEFDPDSMNPYSKIGMDQILSKEHRELATVVATKTFVLLKNQKNVLPITGNLHTAAVVGPMADALGELFGTYASKVVPQYGYTPYQGIKQFAQQTVLAPGCSDNHCVKYDNVSIAKAVNQSTVTFVCMGTGTEIEREGQDRADLNLPKGQLQLLMDVVKYSNGRPVIVLLFTGGPVDISLAKMNPGVYAIIQCFFPSMSTGLALGRVLFTSDQVECPAARMPYTWPASLDQVPPMTNYSMVGRTYRYFAGPGEPLYPFGYGLSYTQFKYSGLSLSTTTLKAGLDINVTCSVTNIGAYSCDDVMQVYISWLDVTVPMPKLQLVGINRELVEKGKTVQKIFTLTAGQLQVWDDSKKFIYQSSRIQVYCGGQQPNQTTTATSNVLTTMFKIVV